MKGKVILLGRRGKAAILQIVSFALLVVASLGSNFLLAEAPKPEEGLEPEAVVLYFDGSQGDQFGLGRETRLMQRRRGGDLEKEGPGQSVCPQMVLTELLNGPQSGSSLAPTIPPGTEVLSMEVEDGILWVDFCPEISAGHWGGSVREKLTVYSIANTLTSLEGVTGVRISISGEQDRTLAGHLLLDQVFSYNDQLVIKP